MLTRKSASDFAAARSRIFFEWLFNLLTRRPNYLLSFDEVKSCLGLHRRVERGLQEIDLNQIVGSVNKYQDFTRSFLPKSEHAELRWRRVDELFHAQGFPPIEVYQIGDAYFVNDGHHRVSVNRTHRIPTIEAHVVEYLSPVSVNPNDTLPDLHHRMAEQTCCTPCQAYSCTV